MTAILRPLRFLFYCGLLAVLCWQIWRVRDGLADSLHAISWRAICLAAGFAVISNFPGFVGWRLLVDRSGIRLTLSDAAWIYFASGATRYLPGAIWPTVTQAAMARKAGVSASRFVALGLFGLAATTVSGIVIGLLALPQLVADDPLWWLLLPVLVAAIAVLIEPRLLGHLLAVGQRMLRRDPQEIVTLPARKDSLAVIGLCGLGWCLNGVHAAVIAIALGASPLPAATLGVGGFALSAVTGALSLTPAGIGVRELVLGLTLGLLVTGPNLVTLLLLSRALTTLTHVGTTLGVLGVVAGNRYLDSRSIPERTKTQ